MRQSSAEAALASMDQILAAMTWGRDDSGRGDENIDVDATCDSLHAEAINSTRCGTREAGQEGQRKQTVYVVVRPNGCVMVQPVCDMIMAMLRYGGRRERMANWKKQSRTNCSQSGHGLAHAKRGLAVGGSACCCPIRA